MSRPFFSILLPSRNRLDLLKHALASIQIQDFSDFEVIVADNASDPPYADRLDSFASPKVRLVRSELPISVTANWNVAIEAARGEYAIMLGDDDALTPGSLSRLSASLQRFDRPDVIYQMAYHYAYPGVFELQPNGYFCRVHNSAVFDLADQPYELEISLARKLGQRALNFHHQISFNAQHFVWKLDYVRAVGYAPFFQSPYPDYFACFATFLTATKIVVVPSPEIIIGIAKQSFGFYFANNRQQEGTQQFFGEQVDHEALAEGDQKVLAALRHPGSVHTRSWLAAALFVKRALRFRAEVTVDLRRYGRIQAFELAQRAGYLQTLSTEEFWANFKEMSPHGQADTKVLLRTFRTLRRVHAFHEMPISYGLSTLLNVYHTPKLEMLDIGPHVNIMDAVRWLARDPSISVNSRSWRTTFLARAFAGWKRDLKSKLQQNIRSLVRSQIVHRSRLKRVITRLLRIVGVARFRQTFEAVKAARNANRLEREIIRQSELFDARWYVKQYPDVTAARFDPLTHYIKFGAHEGRDPNPLFDTDWYLTYYPDVASAKMNPLFHYIEYGSRAEEGRDPHPSFSTLYYLEQNPELAATNLNPLLHYLKLGKAAGRLPSDPNAPYVRHVLKERQQLALQLSELLHHIDTMLYRPVFHIFVTGAKGAAYSNTLASFSRQIYDFWSTSDLDWQACREHFEPNDQTFVMFLRAGDTLNISALYELASTINAYPSVDIVYGDEDKLDADGIRRVPFYKPDWSPDTIEGHNYFGPAACFRGSIASSILADSKSLYDFVLRATELTSGVEHLRAIICHRTVSAADPVSSEDNLADIDALTGRLRRTARTGAVAPAVVGRACYDTKLTLSSEPLVSIIIPTAGTVRKLGGKPTDLLLNCLDKIKERSTYTNLEFIIVDNGDLGEERTELLRQRRCRLVTFCEPTFNVAKKLNLGASIATGAMLLLLNDDIEPLAPDWLERLLEHFEKPHVGVVGAKLLYPDMTVQHAGVVTNLGNPEHVRRGRPRDDPGYFFSTCSVRNFSAVTGACMMTRSDLYRRLGGYNQALAISYNDVDYCFKVRESGLTAVYAPKAELIHFESQSRTPNLELAEAAYFHRRWARMAHSDPFYNEQNLEVLPTSFEVKHSSRIL